MRKFSKIISSICLGLLLTNQVALAAGDLSITGSQVQFSESSFLEGRSIRIYASASNNSDQDLLGIVRFFDNGNQINGDQPISIFGGSTDDVFIDWVPQWGQHTIKVQISPFDAEGDDAGNNIITKTVYINQDTDYDGIPNDQDEDDDGDGVADIDDEFPENGNETVDTDGDGQGDNADNDDDNDEVPDDQDDLPLDPNETTDTDDDGTGDIEDLDDDNDGVSDTEEMNAQTDPLNPDTDGDGVMDGEDPFPLDPNEWEDTDKDQIGNNVDIDDDNDGQLDENDEYPLNKGPVIETDKETYSASLGNRLTLDASASYDEDGNIVSYRWIIDNKILKEGQVISHKFRTLGDHTVKLVIEDNNGEERSNEFIVSVFNTRLYTQVAVIIITLLLGVILAHKYLAEEKLANLKVYFKRNK